MLISGCTGLPSGIEPVTGFELQRYLGRWYEIARLDHSFERGLDRVTADYAASGDGRVTVTNRGYATAENEWKEARGKAAFVESSDVGYLKVSFFGPFYASYVIFELDERDYRYAFVTSSSRDYLWLLSRTPRVPEKVITLFLERSRELGFAVDDLIFVKHE